MTTFNTRKLDTPAGSIECLHICIVKATGALQAVRPSRHPDLIVRSTTYMVPALALWLFRSIIFNWMSSTSRSYLRVCPCDSGNASYRQRVVKRTARRDDMFEWPRDASYCCCICNALKCTAFQLVGRDSYARCAGNVIWTTEGSSSVKACHLDSHRVRRRIRQAARLDLSDTGGSRPHSASVCLFGVMTRLASASCLSKARTRFDSGQKLVVV